MTCLAEPCSSNYGCSRAPKLPIDAEVVAPWVRVTISGAGKSITVGNESSKAFNNKAVIINFQYGQEGAEGGATARIEIADEEGGSFNAFFEKLVDEMSKAVDKYKIVCQWGWVFSDCSGGGGRLGNESKFHHFTLVKVDVKFDKGYIFSLECVDTMKIAQEGRIIKDFGTDDNPMKLKDALTQMFDLACPPSKLEYRRRDPSSGVKDDWDWKEDYKDAYKAQGQTPLATAQEWIRSCTTENDRGVQISWDDTLEDPTVILWEDAIPKPKQTVDCASEHIGTYIVNGGECSPVLEFNPQVKWAFSWIAASGGFSDKGTAKNLKQKDDREYEMEDDCEKESRGGTNTIHGVSDRDIRLHGDQAAEELRKNDTKHSVANRNYQPITAEMRIQGDPELDNPLRMKMAHASIIVINPFFLEEGGGCLEWVPSGTQGGGALATTTCNEVFSNKKWYVFGISHDIRLGAYTTTLKLTLTAPGSSVNAGQNMGSTDTGKQMPG